MTKLGSRMQVCFRKCVTEKISSIVNHKPARSLLSSLLASAGTDGRVFVVVSWSSSSPEVHTSDPQ